MFCLLNGEILMISRSTYCFIFQSGSIIVECTLIRLTASVREWIFATGKRFNPKPKDGCNSGDDM